MVTHVSMRSMILRLEDTVSTANLIQNGLRLYDTLSRYAELCGNLSLLVLVLLEPLL